MVCLFLVESIELGYENHWNVAQTPWSPTKQVFSLKYVVNSKHCNI